LVMLFDPGGRMRPSIGSECCGMGSGSIMRCGWQPRLREGVAAGKTEGVPASLGQAPPAVHARPILG
jgi:hypothetical protein